MIGMDGLWEAKSLEGCDSRTRWLVRLSVWHHVSGVWLWHGHPAIISTMTSSTVTQVKCTKQTTYKNFFFFPKNWQVFREKQNSMVDLYRLRLVSLINQNIRIMLIKRQVKIIVEYSATKAVMIILIFLIISNCTEIFFLHKILCLYAGQRTFWNGVTKLVYLHTFP